MKSGQFYSPEEDNRLVQLRDDGRSFGQIGNMLGRSPDSVRKRYNSLIENRFKREPTKPYHTQRAYTPEEDKLVMIYRRRGMTFKEIGQILNRHKEGVSARFYRLTEKTPWARPLLEAKADREALEIQCQTHADAVMREGGFCAFSDNGNKNTGLGICLPMIWPERR